MDAQNYDPEGRYIHLPAFLALLGKNILQSRHTGSEKKPIARICTRSYKLVVDGFPESGPVTGELGHGDHFEFHSLTDTDPACRLQKELYRGTMESIALCPMDYRLLLSSYLPS